MYEDWFYRQCIPGIYLRRYKEVSASSTGYARKQPKYCHEKGDKKPAVNRNRDICSLLRDKPDTWEKTGNLPGYNLNRYKFLLL